jgi:3-deoxy-D-manno-octulosonic-acid transferase
MTWTRFFYNLTLPLFLVILLPRLLIQLFERGKCGHKFGQRFALYSRGVRSRLVALRPWTWIHAVSVGEVLIALKLIRCMEKKDPRCHFVLSTTTPTGLTLAEREKSETTEVIYNPIDLLTTVRRAIHLIRPRQLILVESEVWPNLVWAAKQYGATVALVNARLSPRSERRYLFCRPVMKPILHTLDIICVQNPSDTFRWEKIGVHPTRIHLTGSIKFDDARAVYHPPRDLRPLLLSIGCPKNALVLLGGSTHTGEEKILGRAFLAIRRVIPNTFLLVAPRHTERSKRVLKDLSGCGLYPVLRSAQSFLPGRINCLILDSIGELQDWYSCVHAVFIGKSLTAHGGQNPAEAIIAGKPVTFGPHMENFSALAQELLSVGGAVISHNEQELQSNLLRMLSDPAWADSLCRNAVECMRRHHGATERTRQILKSGPTPLGRNRD